jgi:hypothetical protein
MPVLERARRGERHPVEDFLFTYYSYRPAQLRRWSPGIGVVLAGAVSDLGRATEWVESAAGVTLAPVPARLAQAAASVVALLESTAQRRAEFGCFGLHEWAMVHRRESHELQHPLWPLRLSPQATTEVVEALPLRCSHFDAFRFFAPTARGLNTIQPGPKDRLALEQGGCLHANMDLYRWAYKLSPWVPAELTADCFDLARRARALDMRASPYDLAALGYAPVAIETPAGRREYAHEQRALSREAADLRASLASAARRVAGVVADDQPERP